MGKFSANEIGYSHSRSLSGTIPEYGAIFMSNTITRSECFERSLFGLPLKFADFVAKVKTGMILFLFDYMTRKLDGVFEAACDGKVNISWGAYKSWGKEFPAQVRFRLIWRCRPLSELTFCDAIKENYYDHNKFRLGLSKEQVKRLLFLFDQTKIEVCITRSFLGCSESEQICFKASSKALLPENSEKVMEKKAESLTSENQPKQDSLDSQTLQMKDDMTTNCDTEQNSENSQTRETDMDQFDTDPGDFIPLPSLDPEEIEILSADKCAEEENLNAFVLKDITPTIFSGTSSSSTSVSEEGEFRPKHGSFLSELHGTETDNNQRSGSYQDKDARSTGSTDGIGNLHSVSKSIFGGLCEATNTSTSISENHMKLDSCLPETKFIERGGHDSDIDHHCAYKVRKLYSDSPQKRASVFSRLAKRSEVASREKSDLIESDDFPHVATHMKAVSCGKKVYAESDLVSHSCRFSKRVSHKKKGHTLGGLSFRLGTNSVSQEKIDGSEGNTIYEVINRLERTSNKWKNEVREKDKTSRQSSGTTGGRVSVFSRLKDKQPVKKVDNKKDYAAEIQASKFSRVWHRNKVHREVLRSSHLSGCGGTSNRDAWEVSITHVKVPRRASGHMGGAFTILNSKRGGDHLNCENENHVSCVGHGAEKQRPEKPLKKRRLDGQCLDEFNDTQNFLCKNCSNFQAPSQESSAAVGNCGSRDVNSNRSDEGDRATSENASLNVVFPINSEGNGTTDGSKCYGTADKEIIVNGQDVGELSGEVKSCPPQCHQEAIVNMPSMMDDPVEKVIAGLEESDVDLKSSYEGSAEPLPFSASLNAESHLVVSRQ